ncbi:MAG TPA: hypothetical protein VFS10_14680 [Pyrinomonadaceae bacterium]|nr:hypothetical protein [Pyrinomonadaceae bacterium]
MRKKALRSTALATLLAATLSITALAASFVLRRGSAKTPTAGQVREKKPRDIAKERDWEAEGSSESHAEYDSLEKMTEGADAIVYGRIVESKSFWDDAGHPVDHGENITTEYTVEIYRVLKDATRNITPEQGKPNPAPVMTPLVIARNGGVVNVNGHRASVKVKQYELLNPGQDYMFFLDWSSAYKAYILAGGASGAVLVNEDLSLKPLASSKELRAKLRGMALDDLIRQVQ